MKLVILITVRLQSGLEVAQGWRDVGAPGVTIVRVHGLHTLQKEVESGDVELPRMIASMASAMASILDSVEERGEMILSLVEDGLVDALIEVSSRICGDLDEPNNGVLFVLPVERAVGVRDHRHG